MISFRNIQEIYPFLERDFDRLDLDSSIVRDKNGSWGSALSLSFDETYEFCKNNNCFIPSVGLMFKLVKKVLNKKNLSEKDLNILQEMNDYWHRTSSMITFPIGGEKGYIKHYFKTDKEIVIKLDENEIPPFGTVSKVEDYPKFFEKFLGCDFLEDYDKDLKEKMNLSLWIPSKECIRTAPQKLIIFGAFMHYGMGIWLTSYTDDKALVGSRPFRVAYEK